MITGVQIIVIQNNKILIAKRNPLRKDGTERIGGGRWNLIGGKIDLGEDSYEAAKRETFEEAGLSLDQIVEVSAKINDWDPEYDPFYAHLFVAWVDDDQNVFLNEEHLSYQFVELDELENVNLLGYDKDEIEIAITQAKSYSKYCEWMRVYDTPEGEK